MSHVSFAYAWSCITYDAITRRRSSQAAGPANRLSSSVVGSGTSLIGGESVCGLLGSTGSGPPMTCIRGVTVNCALMRASRAPPVRSTSTNGRQWVDCRLNISMGGCGEGIDTMAGSMVTVYWLVPRLAVPVSSPVNVAVRVELVSVSVPSIIPLKTKSCDMPEAASVTPTVTLNALLKLSAGLSVVPSAEEALVRPKAGAKWLPSNGTVADPPEYGVIETVPVPPGTVMGRDENV